MRHIFCKDCIYLLYNPDPFNYNPRSSYYCLHPSVGARYRDQIGDNRLRRSSIEPEVLNRNFDCNLYKRKWWKFWEEK